MFCFSSNVGRDLWIAYLLSIATEIDMFPIFIYENELIFYFGQILNHGLFSVPEKEKTLASARSQGLDWLQIWTGSFEDSWNLGAVQRTSPHIPQF